MKKKCGICGKSFVDIEKHKDYKHNPRSNYRKWLRTRRKKD